MSNFRCFDFAWVAHDARCAALLAAMLTSLVACAQEPANERVAAPVPAREAMTAVERVIGDARCDSTADCRTVGVGSKSCGGPERYLAWSARYTDKAELDRLVAQHREARRVEDAQSGRMSNCAVTPEPGVACLANKCQVQGSLGVR